MTVSLPVACGSQTTATSSTTYATTFSVNVPGSAMIMVVTGSSGADTSTGVTDSQSNTYTLAASATTNENVQCWVSSVVTPLTGGTDTFTVTYTTATTQQKNIMSCYMQQAIFPLDLAATNNGSSATASVAGGTPTYYSEMVFAVVQGANGSQPLGAPVTTTGLPYLLLSTEQAAGQQITSLYYQYQPRPYAQSLTSTLNASHPWAMLAVSFPVIDASAAPAVPDFLAGFGPQQGDMLALWTDAARFYQNRVMYRVAQTKTAQSVNGVTGYIKYDTILEDPYECFNSGDFFVAPFDGWYQVTITHWVVGPGTTNVVLYASVLSPVAGNPENGVGMSATNLPSAGGSAEVVWAVYLSAGDTCGAGIAVVSVGSINTSIVAGQQCTMEIVWISA